MYPSESLKFGRESRELLHAGDEILERQSLGGCDERSLTADTILPGLQTFALDQKCDLPWQGRQDTTDLYWNID